MRIGVILLVVGVSLASCQKPPQVKSEEQEIEEFCNVIASEMVANPNSSEPWRRLQQKHLEEEWNFEDVDRICSAAVARKSDLMYGAAGGPADAILPPDWGTALPAADLAAGEAAFARCKSCHTVDAGGANGIGPNLFGVIGRAVASHGGFAYSDAMQAHKRAAPIWTLDELDQFITAPGRHVPGTKMSFAGIRDTNTRVNLIAWLRSRGSGGIAIPAHDPVRQPGAAAPKR
jgi:cytochrome c2